jgi:hypothetical protein
VPNQRLRREKRLGQRHADFAAGAEGGEKAIGFGVAGRSYSIPLIT